MFEVHPEDQQVLKMIEAIIGRELVQLEAFNPGTYQVATYQCNPKGRVIALGLESLGIQDIPPLFHLDSLRVLLLGENRIQSLTPLQHLDSLQILSLYENQIHDITPLQHLSELTTLILEENQIEDISCLSKLKKLKHLDVHGNAIKAIPAPLCHHFSQVRLDWDNHPDFFIGKNPLINPPIQVVKQGREAVLAHFGTHAPSIRVQGTAKRQPSSKTQPAMPQYWSDSERPSNGSHSPY